MMFCPKCGTQNGEGSAFCANCGTPLNNAPSAPQQPPAGGQGYYQPQGYNQAPQGYSQAPQGYSQAPQGYSQAPQGYNQAPQGYNQAPQSYNQSPQPGYYPAQGYGQPARKKSRSTVVAIVVVAALIVLGVAAFFIFRGAGNPLIGTWISSEFGDSISITFKGNGVVEGEFEGNMEQSTYKVKGENLTITDSDGSKYEYTYEVLKEDGKTVLSLYGDGATLTLYKE